MEEEGEEGKRRESGGRILVSQYLQHQKVEKNICRAPTEMTFIHHRGDSERQMLSAYQHKHIPICQNVLN